MKAIGSLLFVTLTSLALPAQLFAQVDHSQPYVESVTYGGTGCPGGSVAASFANDRLSFTLIFDQMVASSGPNIPTTENIKNCQINVNVQVPAGTGQFCTTFDYRGYVQAGANSSAQTTNAYQYNGTSQAYELPDGQVITIGSEPVVKDPVTFQGPIARDYLGRDQDIWNFSTPDPATTTLVLNRELRLFGNASGQITTDSIDARLEPCGSGDTTAPTITISVPVSDGLYGLGTAVTPVFACDDGDGSGVASCTGPSSLDTTSVGQKTFTVTAVDNAGNTSTRSVSYSVGGKDECKSGGFANFLSPTFTNQGRCVSTYASKKK